MAKRASAGTVPGASAFAHPAAAAIDRYFQASLFLLVTTGFATLAGTGRLDTPSVMAVSAALVLRGFLLLRNRTVFIPERWTSLATLAYVLFYVADLFLVSGSYVSASIHLVLFSIVVKLFSAHRDRDHLYLAILSFLAVLSAAVLTVDTVFLISFCVFLLLAVTTFVSMEMRRSAAADSSLTAGAISVRPLARALSTTGVLLAVGIVLGALGLFFVLPRLSAGYLSAYAPRNELVSGFSERVELGQIGRIKQSSTVVMHISLENDPSQRAGAGSAAGLDLKWRGIALALFDGKLWYNPAEHSVVPSRDGRFDLLASQMHRRNSLPAAARQGFRPLRYRVVMEPIGTSVIFLASVPVSLQARLREIGIDENGAVYNLDRSRMTESYQAMSLLPNVPPELLRSRSGDYPPNIVLTYLQLPEVNPRIQTLAEQVTAGAATDYDRALTLEHYLKSNFGYSLDMGSTPPPDPLVHFLFERKEGHCEYFASAMAVMLRALGIPARMVNGFRTSEYNDLTGSYIIRGRDAHSWVEAYMPAYGWVSFDPTPPDPAPSVSAWSRFLLYLDAGREFWREWVINYDFAHQRTLTTSFGLKGRQIADDMKRWSRRQQLWLLARARSAQKRISDSPLYWAGMAVALAAVTLLLFKLPGIVRGLRNLHLARNPGRAPQAAASIWYERMTRALARRGMSKHPSQTPAEFVASIPEPQLRTSVACFTSHYERARFDDSASHAQRLPELFEQVAGCL